MTTVSAKVLMGRARDDASTMEPPYLKPGTLIVHPKVNARQGSHRIVDDPSYWEQDFPDPHWERAGRYGREWFAATYATMEA